MLSRTYAARLRAPVDPNQEMVGLGAANLAAGFFQGFPISSSSSRTPVAEAAGSKTQLTGVVGALAIVRFRTVVRDTQDTAFVILSVIVGMAVGAFAMPPLADRLEATWEKVEAAGFPIKIGATYRWGASKKLWDFEFMPIDEARVPVAQRRVIPSPLVSLRIL